MCLDRCRGQGEEELPFTACRVWYRVPGETCCGDEVMVADCDCGCACACGWGLPCVCVPGCWPCCCRCTFCMCHFCEEVWNLLVGFHTTARCTAGAVSRGSRGRCFFTVAGDAATEEAAALVAALGTVGRRVEAVVAAKDTTLRGMVMED